MSTQCHEHDIHCLVVWAKCAADSMCFHWLSFSDAINRGCLSFWCGMLPDATVGTDKFHSGEMDWWFHNCYSWTNVFYFKLPFFFKVAKVLCCLGMSAWGLYVSETISMNKSPQQSTVSLLHIWSDGVSNLSYCLPRNIHTWFCQELGFLVWYIDLFFQLMYRCLWQ